MIFSRGGKIPGSVYLEVDLPVFQPVHTALVEEVEVFDEEAEEGDDNLQGNRGRKGLFFLDINTLLPFIFNNLKQPRTLRKPTHEQNTLTDGLFFCYYCERLSR